MHDIAFINGLGGNISYLIRVGHNIRVMNLSMELYELVLIQSFASMTLLSIDKIQIFLESLISCVGKLGEI